MISLPFASVTNALASLLLLLLALLPLTGELVLSHETYSAFMRRLMAS